MSAKDFHSQEGGSKIAKIVMDRIRKEQPWAFAPEHELFHISVKAVRWLTALGILLLTLSLVFVLAGMTGKIDFTKDQSTYAVKQISGVTEIGYLDSNTSTLSVSLNDMVASIGDMFMLSSNSGVKSINYPLLLSIFIFFEVLILMNWITRQSK